MRKHRFANVRYHALANPGNQIEATETTNAEQKDQAGEDHQRLRQPRLGTRRQTLIN